MINESSSIRENNNLGHRGGGERTITWVKIGDYVRDYSHLEILKLKAFKDLELHCPI